MKRAYAQQFYCIFLCLEEQIALASWLKMRGAENWDQAKKFLQQISSSITLINDSILQELDKKGYFERIAPNNDSIVLAQIKAFDKIV